MKNFETSTTVRDRGEVRVAGVPFAPGTEVEVTISPKSHAGEAPPTPAEPQPTGGLRWQGNVLVHDGTGTGTPDPLGELNDERLRRLGGGRPGWRRCSTALP